eukprot:2033221-Prymnesium_polylepis.1
MVTARCCLPTRLWSGCLLRRRCAARHATPHTHGPHAHARLTHARPHMHTHAPTHAHTRARPHIRPHTRAQEAEAAADGARLEAIRRLLSTRQLINQAVGDAISDML